MPKRFQFRLQTVLDHRERLEEMKRRLFAEANRRRQLEESRLRGLYQAKDDGLEEMRRLALGRLDLIRMLLYYSYQFGLDRNIGRQTGRLRRATEQTEETRREFLEATRQKRVLENLKARQFRVYMLELDRQEQSFLDDLSLGRYVRELKPTGSGGGAGG